MIHTRVTRLDDVSTHTHTHAATERREEEEEGSSGAGFRPYAGTDTEAAHGITTETQF